MKTRLLILIVSILLIGSGFALFWNKNNPIPTEQPVVSTPELDPKDEYLERIKLDAIQSAIRGCKIENATIEDFEYETFGGQVDHSNNSEYFSSTSPITSKLDVVSLSGNIRWAFYSNNVEGRDFGIYEVYCFDESGLLRVQSYQESMRTEDDEINEVSFDVEYDDSGKPKPGGIKFQNSNPKQIRNFDSEQPPAPRYKAATDLRNSIRTDETK